MHSGWWHEVSILNGPREHWDIHGKDCTDIHRSREFQQVLDVFKSYSAEALLRFAALFSLALPAVGCVHSVEPLVNFLIQTPGLVISLIFVLLIVFQCTTLCSGCRTVCIGFFGLRQA